MALKRLSQMPAFNGVAAGATATLDIPIGPTYDGIVLKVSDGNNANAATIISEIRVNVNGKTQRKCTVAELDALNSLMNDPASVDYTVTQDGSSKVITQAKARSLILPGVSNYSLFKDAANVTRLPIFFAEPWRPPSIAEQFAWGTGNLNSFQLEVDIASAASSPVLKAYAMFHNAILTTNGIAKAAPIGLVTKWYREQLSITADGVTNWTLQNKRDTLLSMHFFDPQGGGCGISNIQVLADSYEWRDLSQNDNQFELARNKMVPSAGRYDLVFDVDDISGSAGGGSGLPLAGIQDLRINVTTTSGGARNITVMVQKLGPPD